MKTIRWYCALGFLKFGKGIIDLSEAAGGSLNESTYFFIVIPTVIVYVIGLASWLLGRTIAGPQTDIDRIDILKSVL